MRFPRSEGGGEKTGRRPIAPRNLPTTGTPLQSFFSSRVSHATPPLYPLLANYGWPALCFLEAVGGAQTEPLFWELFEAMLWAKAMEAS